ncbi:GNAT family N-acetyltransferase [Pedobacter sp. L105]|uniref:GNAT family N-acetyltransferase n=1 Tax=Pedobacter sp. L105 TaxID=1641871 RepID=UPI00131E3FD6|nr:GNAT family N-acetyltransferase [Pedobacter sp. L105]
MNAIITERLILRRPKETDLKDFLAYRNDAENLKFQPIQPINEETALSFLKKQMLIDEEKETGWVMFALELKDTHQMIGEVGIYISPDDKSTSDLGWSVFKDEQGKGYAAEAASALLDYAFKLRRLNRVTASCVSTNTASLQLMKRLGMHREVDRTHHQYINGICYDEYIYAISCEEWSASDYPS